MTSIPAGYQLHFTSWENDADAYATVIWSGIESHEDVCFLIDLANRFTSHNDNPPGLGNDEIKAETLIGLIRETMDKHPEISIDMSLLFTNEIEEEQDDDELADRWWDLLTDKILHSPIEEGYRTDFTRFCRVISSVEVYLVPDTIRNVTDQFIV